jgi:short-subunit dehydrogenase
MDGEPGEDASRPVILITGASAGLGRTLARELARRRPAATLILVARRLDRLAELAGELRTSHPDLEVATIAADLADAEAPGRLAAEAVARFGGIDVLVNNAGLGLPTQFADADPGLIARQIAVNFVAPLMLTRHCLPTLIERRGMIINISSAITCVPNSALGAYGATKAGLSYWNDALRRELIAGGHGVRVCLVEPGPVRTEFMDAARSRLAPGEGVDPIVGNMRDWMTAEVDDAARRIARLLDHPRRRLSMLRRLVWPFRALGALARLCPPLGDRVVVRLTRRPIAPKTNAE